MSFCCTPIGVPIASIHGGPAGTMGEVANTTQKEKVNLYKAPQCIRQMIFAPRALRDVSQQQFRLLF
jgi:hypothetical protein